MGSSVYFSPLLLPIIMLGLAGCAEIDLRKGPDPVISAASVQAATDNSIAIIAALAKDAGYNLDGTVDYYKVAEAGFNFVDDQCTSYFDRLFFIDRGRAQLKSGLP